jgi:hypothetical protein
VIILHNLQLSLSLRIDCPHDNASWIFGTHFLQMLYFCDVLI